MPLTYQDILQREPYGVSREEKRALLTEKLKELTAHHAAACSAYGRMLRTIGYDSARTDSYEQLPFLPVRLFKEMELMSVPRGEVFKTMTSSGTTGQAVSRIFLDRATAANQQKTLGEDRFLLHRLGAYAHAHHRLPLCGQGPHKILGARRGHPRLFHLRRRPHLCAHRRDGAGSGCCQGVFGAPSRAAHPALRLYLYDLAALLPRAFEARRAARPLKRRTYPWRRLEKARE